MSGTKCWVDNNEENGQGSLTYRDYSSLCLLYMKNTSHYKIHLSDPIVGSAVKTYQSKMQP